MMVEQCHLGCFNSQSTANAWWAVSKLCTPGHPASVDLLAALEAASAACLTLPTEAERPNAQVRAVASRAAPGARRPALDWFGKESAAFGTRPLPHGRGDPGNSASHAISVRNLATHNHCPSLLPTSPCPL